MPLPTTDETSVLFTNGTLVLSDRLIEDGELVVEDGMIRSVGAKRKRAKFTGRVIDLKGSYLAPGFIDIHVHGGGGADYMDGTADAVRVANRCHARHGTTTIFPTTTTDRRHDRCLW